MEIKAKPPRISVIMGIYNCAETLPEALDSLISQTYKEFKMILCDDGSNDDTYAIARRYADKYDNILLLKNDKNIKLAATLNYCLEYVDTEYVARMDGDDISMPTRFEKQINFLDKNLEIDFASSAMIYFDDQGEFKQGNVIEYPQIKDFIRSTPFCHAPCMVRKKSYDAVNGYSVKKMFSRVEDYHLWFKMYSLKLNGYNFNEPLYKMRDDRSAYSRRKFRYRINEMYVKFIGFKMLKLPFYYNIFVLKPIIIGLLPYCFYIRLHKKLLQHI